MKENENKKKQVEYEHFLAKVFVGIHEVSEITQVSARKIRYWQNKGYIQTVNQQAGASRQYNLLNIKKIIMIDHLLKQGLTLESAAAIVNRKVILSGGILTQLTLNECCKNEPLINLTQGSSKSLKQYN